MPPPPSLPPIAESAGAVATTLKNEDKPERSGGRVSFTNGYSFNLQNEALRYRRPEDQTTFMYD